MYAQPPNCEVGQSPPFDVTLRMHGAIPVLLQTSTLSLSIIDNRGNLTFIFGKLSLQSREDYKCRATNL
jgi:hypothetical protein